MVLGHNPSFPGSGPHLSHSRVPLPAPGKVPVHDMSQEASEVPRKPPTESRSTISTPKSFLEILPAARKEQIGGQGLSNKQILGLGHPRNRNLVLVRATCWHLLPGGGHRTDVG